eukprot:2858654-Amphidinium_carterae.1
MQKAVGLVGGQVKGYDTAVECPCYHQIPHPVSAYGGRQTEELHPPHQTRSAKGGDVLAAIALAEGNT